MDCKIDMSWIRKEANYVLSQEVQRKLYGSVEIDAITPYLYLEGVRLFFGYKKATFDNCKSREVSVNDVLSGRWKVKEMTKSEIEKALGYKIKVVGEK